MLSFDEREFEKILSDVGIPTKVKRVYDARREVYSYRFSIAKKKVQLRIAASVFEATDKKNKDRLEMSIHLEVARYRLGMKSLVLDIEKT